MAGSSPEPSDSKNKRPKGFESLTAYLANPMIPKVTGSQLIPEGTSQRA
jgi:hypothetical protein